MGLARGRGQGGRGRPWAQSAEGRVPRGCRRGWALPSRGSEREQHWELAEARGACVVEAGWVLEEARLQGGGGSSSQGSMACEAEKPVSGLGVPPLLSPASGCLFL